MLSHGGSPLVGMLESAALKAKTVVAELGGLALPDKRETGASEEAPHSSAIRVSEGAKNAPAFL
ncbi:hypothetical protein [Desulfobotulus mexicanus]|uniref:hypothetical protein n=1 Tax=Desulfobotulus mexicanus TaxID=2586642 RepID=UPI0015D17ADE|nr:hypothetical protein [Desulfobotulus mexicanus]